MTVIEIKSMTSLNEVRQLRMGLGQALDYGDRLERRGLTVRRGLYVQRCPADPRWVELAERAGVSLAWPGVASRLGLTTDEVAL